MLISKIILTGVAKAEFDAKLQNEYPGMDIQRARIYEKEPDQFEVHVQVLGLGRTRSREIISPNDPERKRLYEALEPNIRQAKRRAEQMLKAADATFPPDCENFEDAGVEEGASRQEKTFFDTMCAVS